MDTASKMRSNCGSKLTYRSKISVTRKEDRQFCCCLVVALLRCLDDVA